MMNAKTALDAYQVDFEECVSLPPIPKWHACLTRHRLKPSKQRDVILAAFARQKHVTAPALYGVLFEEGHRISLGTVYRTLNLLCKLGFAKTRRFYSQTLYEHVLNQTQQQNNRISCRLV
ncbi:transcriptional repressor [Nitrospira sp. Ecomares 2.1]